MVFQLVSSSLFAGPAMCSCTRTSECSAGGVDVPLRAQGAFCSACRKCKWSVRLDAIPVRLGASSQTAMTFVSSRPQRMVGVTLRTMAVADSARDTILWDLRECPIYTQACCFHLPQSASNLHVTAGRCLDWLTASHISWTDHNMMQRDCRPLAAYEYITSRQPLAS